MNGPAQWLSDCHVIKGPIACLEDLRIRSCPRCALVNCDMPSELLMMKGFGE
jgi:hypothetical protein